MALPPSFVLAPQPASELPVSVQVPVPAGTSHSSRAQPKHLLVGKAVGAQLHPSGANPTGTYSLEERGWACLSHAQGARVSNAAEPLTRGAPKGKPNGLGPMGTLSSNSLEDSQTSSSFSLPFPCVTKT